MSLLRSKAIVLQRTNYGEADRILQLLTPDHGKIGVIAKGVRREKSRLAGGVELFGVCDVTVTSGRGELGILTGARLEVFFGNILHDYERLQAGYEAIKQVNKAVASIDDAAFYHLLEQVLGALDKPEINLQVIRAWFYLQLAILLGIGANLATDNNGKKLEQNTTYAFSEEDMAFTIHTSGRFGTDHIKLLRILSGHPPQVAMQVQGYEKLIGDCLWVAERAAAH